MHGELGLLEDDREDYQPYDLESVCRSLLLPSNPFHDHLSFGCFTGVRSGQCLSSDRTRSPQRLLNLCVEQEDDDQGLRRAEKPHAATAKPFEKDAAQQRSGDNADGQ